MYSERSKVRLFERLTNYSANLRPLVEEGEVRLFEIVSWPN